MPRKSFRADFYVPSYGTAEAVPFPCVVVLEIKIAANFRAPDAVVVTTRKSIHDLAREGHDFPRAE